MKCKLFVCVAMPVICLTTLVPGCKKHEHPQEQPKETAQSTTITKDELADAIKAYVDKQAAESGGYFIVPDDKTGQTLKLSLLKVHRKRLSRVGPDLYFACADFETPQGKTYDLDVFMTGADKDALAFSKFMVHKEQGKERYNWYQKGDIWVTKPVGGNDNDDHEHPKEHPK